MAQQFDSPQTETQLREIQDKLYQHSKEVYDAGGRPAFKGLLEIMSAEATIVTAIHNIKSNHGSETPGVDSKTVRKDYRQPSHSWVIRYIQSAFQHFEPPRITPSTCLFLDVLEAVSQSAAVEMTNSKSLRFVSRMIPVQMPA